MEETIIVIGGLSAGPSAAAKARRTNENARIILFEKTRYVSYATCGIPYSISGTIKERDKLMVVKAELLNKRFNIDVKLEEEVLDVLPERHIVQTTKGWYKYSKLIFATGASPSIPPIKNIENTSDWSHCRTIENFDKLKEDGVLSKRKNITILGAGLIGVEVSENLRKIGKQVNLVEMAPQILPQWDAKFGGLASQTLQSNGIKVLTNVKVTEAVIQKGKLKSLKLGDGTTLSTDYLIIGTGGKPNTGLLTSKGAEHLANGALVVNERMETSLPDIFAAGDCASIMNLQTGRHDYFPMGTHSNKGGRTAGANAAGGEETFTGAYKTAIVKVFDYTLGRTGMNAAMLKTEQMNFGSTFFITPATPGFYPGATDLFIELHFNTDDRKILGVEIYGEKGVDKRIDVFSTAIYAGLTIDDLPNLDLAYAPPYSPAKDAVVLAGYITANGLNKKVSEIKIDELKQIIGNGKDACNILDVRSPQEIENEGYIPGSVNIELDKLREQLEDIDLSKETIVYCAKGLRGYVAGMILANCNCKKVFNVGGGFNAWKKLNTSEDAFLVLNEV